MKNQKYSEYFERSIVSLYNSGNSRIMVRSRREIVRKYAQNLNGI